MTLLRKLAGETAFYGFSYILSRVLHYILLTWYLTNRVFEPTEFGIYRDLYFWVAVLVVILTFRMETTYFRYAKEDRPAVTTMSLAFLLTTAVIFLLSLWIFRYDVANALDYPKLTKHIMMLGVVLAFDVLSAVPFASLRQQNRPLLFLSLKVGSILLNIGLVLFFIEWLPLLGGKSEVWSLKLNADKLFYVILANLLASAITLLFLLPLLRNQPFRWDFSFLKRMLHYSWPLVIVGFAGVINQYSSIAFQKYLLEDDLTSNLAEGGKYAAAASIAIILSLFTTAYNYAAEPFFFAHKEKQEARAVYADAALAYTIIASLMMLIILAYLDVFQLLIGKNFRDTLEVVPILLVSFIFLGIYYNVSAWYKLADKTIWGAFIACIGMIITVVLSYLLIKTLGPVGSAWTALGCYVFMVVTAYLLGQKFYPIPYKIWRMLGWIVVAIMIYFVMEWLRGFYEGQLAVIIVVNTILIFIYIIIVFLTEKHLVRQIRGKIDNTEIVS